MGCWGGWDGVWEVTEQCCLRSKVMRTAGFTLVRRWADSYLGGDITELLKTSLAWCVTELRDL